MVDCLPNGDPCEIAILPSGAAIQVIRGADSRSVVGVTRDRVIYVLSDMRLDIRRTPLPTNPDAIRGLVEGNLNKDSILFLSALLRGSRDIGSGVANVSTPRGLSPETRAILVDLYKAYGEYKDGNLGKRGLYTVLLPIINEITSQSGSDVGFIPTRGGHITILQREGKYYALSGNMIVHGDNLEHVLSNFAHETSVIQIVSREGRVIGSIETPTSRVLRAMVYMHHDQLSIWEQISGGLEKNMELEYSDDDFRITLRGQKGGITFGITEAQNFISGVGRYHGWNGNLGYKVAGQNGYIHTQIGIGLATTPSGETVRGYSAALDYHITGRLPGDALRAHFVGSNSLIAQVGPSMRLVTGDIRLDHKAIISGKDWYGGIKYRNVWAPEIITRELGRFRGEVSLLLGVRWQDVSIGISAGASGYSLGLQNDACRFEVAKKSSNVNTISPSSTTARFQCAIVIPSL